jgi:hypothetical protein
MDAEKDLGVGPDVVEAANAFAEVYLGRHAIVPDRLVAHLFFSY